MKVCVRCGWENPDESDYCGKCAVPLGQEPCAAGTQVRQPDGSFERAMCDLGRGIERGMTELGKTLEREADRVGKEAEDWWYRTFGLFGPLLAGLIGFLAAVLLLMVFALVSMERVVRDGMADLLWTYAWLMLVLALLGSYNTYMYKRHREHYKWAWPVVGGACVFGWAWLGVWVLDIFGSGTGTAFIVDVSGFLEMMLIPILVLSIAIGYAAVFGRELLGPRSGQR